MSPFSFKYCKKIGQNQQFLSPIDICSNYKKTTWNLPTCLNEVSKEIRFPHRRGERTVNIADLVTTELKWVFQKATGNDLTSDHAMTGFPT